MKSRNEVHVANLTAHTLRVYDGETVIAEWPTTEPIARREEQRQPLPALHTSQGDVPVVGTTYGSVVDLPEPVEGTVYVVSRVLAEAVRERTDVFFPAEEVRDSDGRIVGCRSFGRFMAG